MTGKTGASATARPTQREIDMKTLKLWATTALCLTTGLTPAMAQVTALGTPEGQAQRVVRHRFAARQE